MMTKNQTNSLAGISTDQDHGDPVVSQQALAHIGDGKLAYVKAVRSDEIGKLFPNAPAIAPGLDLFVLLSASGTPLVIADSADAAKVNAWNNDLETVSLH
jgi:hypothetical protein